MSNPTILVTNGGPHPPDKWAEVTTNAIVALSDTADPAAHAFRTALLALLCDAHASVQQHARDTGGDALDPAQHTITNIIALARNTPFAEHFASVTTQDYLLRLLREHFATIVDIERQWQADRAQE